MTEQHTTLGFIGIGRMGAPMAQRLLDAGYGLAIYDTNTAAVEALVAKGARRVESPKAVGDAAEIVLLSLPMPDIMTAVALGTDGVVHGAKVRTVVDLSTSGRRAALMLAGGLKERDIAAIDCPVSGGVAGATKGTLALMASGVTWALSRPGINKASAPKHQADRARAPKLRTSVIPSLTTKSGDCPWSKADWTHSSRAWYAMGDAWATIP